MSVKTEEVIRIRKALERIAKALEVQNSRSYPYTPPPFEPYKGVPTWPGHYVGDWPQYPMWSTAKAFGTGVETQTWNQENQEPQSDDQ